MLKTSVIIPTYNRSKYLSDALDSVLRQTFQDLEIIVVDDGSIDNSRDIVSRYAERHPGKIRYFYQDNKGPSAARNVGIKEAKGDFIAFLDSDDLWLPDKLKEQLDVFSRNNKLGLVYTGCCIVDSNGLISGEYNVSHIPKRKVLSDIYIRNSTSQTSSMMIRKTCFDEIGLFDEGLVVAERIYRWFATNYTLKDPVPLDVLKDWSCKEIEILKAQAPI